MKKYWNWLIVDKNRKTLSFLGTGIAVVVAAGCTFFTYLDQDKSASENEDRVPPVTKTVENEKHIHTVKKDSVRPVAKVVESKQHFQANEEPVPKNRSEKYFIGTYIGISTEGAEQLPIKISFKHNGNKVIGTYTLDGSFGTMEGTVTGNTFNYTWRLGGYSGRGVSVVQGNTVKGIWGYDFSNNNGGTLIAQLQ